MRCRYLPVAAMFLAAGCSTMQAKAVDPMERANAISAKISESERLAAASCSPRDLARVKVGLDRMVHKVEEGYYSAGWLEPGFDAVDQSADRLLAERRVAASMGDPAYCLSASRQPVSR